MSEYCDCPKKPGEIVEVDDIKSMIHADCGKKIGRTPAPSEKEFARCRRLSNNTWDVLVGDEVINGGLEDEDAADIKSVLDQNALSWSNARVREALEKVEELVEKAWPRIDNPGAIIATAVVDGIRALKERFR